MKKWMVFLMCFVIGTGALTGCSSDSAPFTQKNYTADGETISEIHIDVRDREIEVTASPDDQIHIDYFENDKEFYDISVSDGNVLAMTAATDKEWTDYIGTQSSENPRKISLQIPDALIGTLKIATTNEDITVAALAFTQNVSLTANGGNISFDKLHAGNEITLDAKNGDISGVIDGSYEEYAISCDVKKGESNLPSSKEKGNKTLSVTANNGDVAIDFA